MAGSKLVGVDKVNDAGEVREWVEGDPQPFVLRGNAECERLIASLDELGVASFSCLCRTRYGDSADVFSTTPEFKKGIRLSHRRLEEVWRATRRVGDYVWKAVFQAVEETGAEGCDLLIEANVIIGDPDHPRGIVAWVTAFVTCETDFEDREMWLL